MLHPGRPPEEATVVTASSGACQEQRGTSRSSRANVAGPVGRGGMDVRSQIQVPDVAARVAAITAELERPIPEDVLWLVAEVDGQAVGDAHAKLHEPEEDAADDVLRDSGRRRAYLEYMAVQARYRSQGIGG